MVEISGGMVYLFDDQMQLLASVPAPMRLLHYGRVDVSVDLTKQTEQIRRAVRHYQLVFPLPVLVSGNDHAATVTLTSKVIPLEVPNG